MNLSITLRDLEEQIPIISYCRHITNGDPYVTSVSVGRTLRFKHNEYNEVLPQQVSSFTHKLKRLRLSQCNHI